MKLPVLKIADLVAKIPIIQGGMAVRISGADLAAAVAEEGGIGVIAGTGLTPQEIKDEIRKARSKTDGIIGINVLFAVQDFAKLIMASIEEKIDLVISGAGFSRDMFTWGKSYNVPIVPIVSSAKLAQLAQKLGAAAVIVEGKEAGGHLGTDRCVKDILPEVRAAVEIPVIAAGGVMHGQDIVEMLKLGANGVQMGTRFAASKESGASEVFKQLYVNSTADDITLIESPVGLPGRALKSPLVERLIKGNVKTNKCNKCLKKCSHSFCILTALSDAQVGNFQNGLFFSGERVNEIKEILSVKEIFERLLHEVEGIAGTEVLV